MAKFGKYSIKLEKSDEKGMLDLQAIKEFSLKAENSICKIKINEENNSYGSCFFCKIPFTKNKNYLLPVLITNYHVLPKNMIKPGANIKLILQNDIKIISINLSRKIRINENMDFSIIEIIDIDKIDDFFYLDDNIFKNTYTNQNYIGKNVIVYGMNRIGKIKFSNGKIEKINHFSFAYNCNTYPGCSGGCIVNQNNNCVIGIHRGEKKTKKEKVRNAGIFIWNIINYIKSLKDVDKIQDSSLKNYFNKKSNNGKKNQNNNENNNQKNNEFKNKEKNKVTKEIKKNQMNNQKNNQMDNLMNKQINYENNNQKKNQKNNLMNNQKNNVKNNGKDKEKNNEKKIT